MPHDASQTKQAYILRNYLWKPLTFYVLYWCIVLRHSIQMLVDTEVIYMTHYIQLAVGISHTILEPYCNTH